MIIKAQVLLELKAVRAIERSHKAQLLNYLRCTQVEIGLILNFGPHPQFRRLAFDNRKKKPLALASTSEALTKSEWSDLENSTKRSALSAKSAGGFLA